MNDNFKISFKQAALMKNPDDEHQGVIDELSSALKSYNAKSEKEKEKVKDPELRKLIELQQEKLSKMEEQITYFRQNNKEMEDQLEVLQDEYNDLQSNFDLANEEINSLKEEASNLEADVAHQMEKDKKAEEEKEKLKDKIKQLEDKLKEVPEIAAGGNEDEVNIGEMKFNYEIKISALENKLKELNSKLTGSEKSVKQISNLEGVVKQKEIKIKEEKALFDKREKENKELLSQIEQMRRDHQNQIINYETKVKNLEEEIDRLTQREVQKKIDESKPIEASKTHKEKFSKAKLQEIIDSSKLAQNILNILDANPEIKLKFIAMQLGTSQKKCLAELKKLEEINFITLEYAKPGDKNPVIKTSK